MSLRRRLASLARADAHGVVDALEDPALVLKQQLREADEELARKRCRLEVLGAEREALEKEDRRLEERSTQLDQDIELALASDKEELARFAIKRLLPIRRRRDEIAARREHLSEEHQALGERLQAQEAELASLRERARTCLRRMEQGMETPRCWSDTSVTDEEVELELLRRQESDAGRPGKGGG